MLSRYMGCSALLLAPPVGAFWAEDMEVPCEFERLVDADMTEERQAIHFSKDEAMPTILSDITADWPARTKWSIEYLDKEFGDLPVSSSEMTNGFRAMWDFSKQLYVRDILNASLIFFTNTELAEGLKKDMGRIPAYLQRHSGMLGLSVGAPGAYAKHHDHHPSWFAQISGRKLWVVTAPHVEHPWTTTYPDVCNMPEEAFVGLDVKRCIAQAGDVLYLPPNWGHSTCNLDHAISTGVIGPFHNAVTHAAQTQNLQQIGKLIKMEEWKTNPGLPAEAMLYAATFGHIKVASLLLRHGSDSKGGSNDVPFVLEAAARGHASMVAYLEQRGADSWPEEGASAFDVAALNGHMTVVKDLFQGCEACVVEDLGKEATPLHHAVQEGHIPVMDFLVNHDNSTPAENRTRQLLYLAAANGHAAAIDRLLAQPLRADPSDAQAVSSYRGPTQGRDPEPPLHVHAFHVASINGHFKAVDRLLDRGVGVDAVNVQNDQAIHQCAMLGVVEMVQHLLDRNADPEATSGSGATALQLAQLSGHEAVAGVLGEVGSHGEL